MLVTLKQLNVLKHQSARKQVKEISKGENKNKKRSVNWKKRNMNSDQRKRAELPQKKMHIAALESKQPGDNKRQESWFKDFFLGSQKGLKWLQNMSIHLAPQRSTHESSLKKRIFKSGSQQFQ